MYGFQIESLPIHQGVDTPMAALVLERPGIGFCLHVGTVLASSRLPLGYIVAVLRFSSAYSPWKQSEQMAIALLSLMLSEL
jgi:hypothetical protein